MSQPDPQSPAEAPTDFTVSLPESWRRTQAPWNGPMQRIGAIEDSLRCFTYGWLSCLPVVGVAYLYPAVRRFLQVRRRNADWNPARGYLAAGLALTSAGWIVTLTTWLVVLNAALFVGEPRTADDGVKKLLPTVLLLGALPALAGMFMAGVTAFPQFESWLRSEQFVLQFKRYRAWLVVLGIAWCVWPFMGLPMVSQETTTIYGPIVSWALWLFGGLGCLPLLKLGHGGKRLAWLAFVIWLVGVALLAQIINVD